MSLFTKAQIIADHSVVDLYNDIPQKWIDSVKTMLVCIAGESHSGAYRFGQVLLEQLDSRFQVLTYENDPPPGYSDQYLRIGRPFMMGEASFFNQNNIDYFKEYITGQNESGNAYDVMGFGWCWDMTWTNPPGGIEDPFYHVRWAGSSEDGPDGNMRWGLDSDDELLTGNSVCMDTYLDAVEQYITHCESNGYPTKWIFTTGPVDGLAGTENGFQRELKHDHIRNYVKQDVANILFDYADILCWNNDGEHYTTIWDDEGNLRSHANIHPDNMMDYDSNWNYIESNDDDADHIGEVGALRIAKAMWWMLARIAGWDGNTGMIPVTGITVTGEGGVNTISTDNGQLQLTASVLPADASNKSVTWTIQNGTGQATINSNGLVTAVADGTVSARATANDGSGIYGTMIMTISNQVVPVSGITVAGEGGISVISTDNGQLQLVATVLPSNATNKSVTWSVQNGTGQASINTSGLVTAISNGTVTARATANDGSGVSGSLIITISNQIVPVNSITISGTGGATSITTDNGQLQLTATILPAEASNKSVTWSLENGTGQASISTTGMVTAISNGTVTARATANDGSGISGTLVITISNQLVSVTSITIEGAGGSSTISTDGGQLQLNAIVLPAEANNKTVTWSVENGTGYASINSTGLITAISNGTVTARASANDGSGISGTLLVTISNQIVPVSGITVTGAGGVTSISTDDGQLQITATIAPAYATVKTVTWSVENGTGSATINNNGLLTAAANGTVTVKATANDGSGIYGTLVITISNQIVPVSGIIVAGSSGATTITTDNGQLQLIATVSPDHATNKTVSWSITGGTGSATINASGLVTAISNGIVTVRATATDGSGIYGSLTLTISNQVTPVASIAVTGQDGATSITTDNGTLQLISTVLPANATNKSVTWSVQDGTGQAGINATGLVTAISDGTVIARATANDGSNVSGTLTISITNQVIQVVSITVSGEAGSSSISTDNGQLQLIATVLPSDATNKSITWSIQNNTGEAVISTSGVVSALSNGIVTARATANDGSSTYGTLQITITNQTIEVAGISVTGAGGATSITTDNGQLQLTANILPANATNKSVTWSIANGTGRATISPAGMVTAISNGSVTATATANDGSEVTGSLTISIINQIVPVTAINVTGQGGSSSITIDNGTLQLLANISPEYATDKTVTWTIENGTGQAAINSSGLVTAVSNGNVVAVATANDGSGISGSMTLTLSNQVIHVNNITVTGQGGSNTISTDNGQLQLSAAVLPSNASNKAVTWSLQNGSGQASINALGLVTAIANGTVTARATANDGSAVFGILEINISNQIIQVSEISVTGEGGANIITQENGTLRLIATVTPAIATNKSVTWSIHNGTGEATISATGIVTAVSNGTVTARASANDGSGITGELMITISDQIIPVSAITVTGQGGSASISADNGTLQLNAAVSPDNATDKAVIWSVQNGSGQALISNTGLVSAISNGTVTARATANDGSGISGTIIINISNQVVPVTGITVSSAGGSTSITTDEGQLQLTTSVLPENASNKSVTWSIVNQSGYATINASGIVTAYANGTVIARATANDGSGVSGSLELVLSNQTALVTSISVTGAGGSTSITNDNGQLQLSTAILPVYAEIKSVTWSIENGTGEAIINSAGLVTALANGSVTARATSNDGSGISGTLNIAITNQIISVAGISLSGPGGSNTINTDNGQIQLTATIVPENATNKAINWSIQNVTGTASISSTGLVTAVSNGNVIARATAVDGSLAFGTLTITISNQVTPVTGIIVTGAGGSSVIGSDNGQLQLTATVIPAEATNPSVTWSIQNGTGQATISPSGLVTAVSDGTVTARATTNDGSGISGTLQITITSQVVYVAGISITSSGGIATINNDIGTLQLIANITPLNATTQSVTWSVENGTGLARVNSSGLVTALADGTVTIVATANDGSGVSGTFAISIYNQTKHVTSITITAAGGITTITSLNATLQLNATVLPADATNPNITWTVENGTGEASISSTGLLTALAYGSVIVRATANDGSGITATLEVTITNFQVLVQTIVVYGTGLVNAISVPGGTLQMNANIFPAVATNKTVEWSLINGNNELAAISAEGLLTAIANGQVTVQAAALDGSGVTGILIITITNQSTPVEYNEIIEKRRIHFNNIFVDVVLDISKVNSLYVCDMQGKVLSVSKLETDADEIFLSELVPGVYLFVFRGEEVIKTVKVVAGE